MEEICRDICSSAPQFIWLAPSVGDETPFSPLQTLQCYTLLGPLYIAGQVCRDRELRAWIIESMRYMADIGKMKRAKQVVDILETSPTVPYWTIYTMLGSYVLAA